MSSLATHGIGEAANKLGFGKQMNSLVGSMAFGGFTGGVTSVAMGESFWQGFATGAIVGGLNNGLHSVAETIRVGRLAASYASSKASEYFNKRGVQYKLVAAPVHRSLQ